MVLRCVCWGSGVIGRRPFLDLTSSVWLFPSLYKHRQQGSPPLYTTSVTSHKHVFWPSHCLLGLTIAHHSLWQHGPWISINMFSCHGPFPPLTQTNLNSKRLSLFVVCSINTSDILLYTVIVFLYGQLGWVY